MKKWEVRVNGKLESRWETRELAMDAARQIRETWGPLYVVRVERE